MTGETVDPKPMLVADVRLTDDAPLPDTHWHVWPKAPEGRVFQLAAQFADDSSTVDTSPEAVTKLLATRTSLSEEHIAAARG